MLKVGTKVFLKNYGIGAIKKIDTTDNDFKYLVRFFNKGRTLVWLPADTKFGVVSLTGKALDWKSGSNR